VSSRTDKGSPALYVYVRASNVISEALYTLQVSQIRRLYTCCKCHKFRGFIYVASGTNSETLYKLHVHHFVGFIYVASLTNSEALFMLQVASIRKIYISCMCTISEVYILCKCHKFGGFINVANFHQIGNFVYVESVTNSEALHTLQVLLTTGL
jgi:hypothetical protein